MELHQFAEGWPHGEAVIIKVQSRRKKQGDMKIVVQKKEREFR
jgi:hypothetical protein